MSIRAFFSLCLAAIGLLTGCSHPTDTCRVAIDPVTGAKRGRICAGKGLIVIDAGHGGKDLGAESDKAPKYQEKIYTLTTAKMLESYLKRQGYRTVMTRNDDFFVSLSERAKFANGQHPILFVSVHYNSAPKKQAHGVEVYYYRSDTDKERSSASKKLAQADLDNVIAQTEAKSRGVKHGNFAVIRETNMPAILIEGGFLSNDEELKKIKRGAYQKKIAWGIVQGIEKYLK